MDLSILQTKKELLVKDQQDNLINGYRIDGAIALVNLLIKENTVEEVTPQTKEGTHERKKSTSNLRPK